MFYTLVFTDCTHGVKDQSEMQSLSAEMSYTWPYESFNISGCF